MRPPFQRPIRCLAFSAALFVTIALLSGCAPSDDSPRPPGPEASVTARRATASATRLVRDPRARDGVALVIQAVALLRTETADPRGSAELYGTAYAGTATELRRRGGTVTDPPLALTNDPATDAAIFTDAYLTLAGALEPGADQIGLAYAAIRTVTNRLDECNTYLLTPMEERQRQVAATQEAGGYVGIGVNIRADATGATIAVVYPDTPAARAQLRPDDRLLAVDGTALAGSTAEQIGALLRGPQGSAVTLTIARAGESGPRPVVVTRAGVQPPALTSRVVAIPAGQPAGVIRLATLSDGAAGELERALSDFATRGITSWVLDLRGSGGGSAAALLAFAAPLLGGDSTVALRVQEAATATLTTIPATSAANPPRAVLIDGGTTGMAEVLAAALVDKGGERTIGETTAGCVSLREDRALPDGAVLALGVAQLRSSGGRELARIGQSPQEIVLNDPTGATDPPLLAALR